MAKHLILILALIALCAALLSLIGPGQTLLIAALWGFFILALFVLSQLLKRSPSDE